MLDEDNEGVRAKIYVNTIRFQILRANLAHENFYCIPLGKVELLIPFLECSDAGVGPSQTQSFSMVKIWWKISV